MAAGTLGRVDEFDKRKTTGYIRRTPGALLRGHRRRRNVLSCSRLWEQRSTRPFATLSLRRSRREDVRGAVAVLRTLRICGDFSVIVNPVSKLDRYPVSKGREPFCEA